VCLGGKNTIVHTLLVGVPVPIWWEKTSSAIVYMVKNKITDAYAIIFKRQVFKPSLSFLIQLYEDLNIGRQDPLPHSRLGNAKVAAGILDILSDISDPTYEGRTLRQVLNDLPVQTKVYITGHSIGGSLATAYSFTDLFDPNSVNYLFTESSRCINTRDIMPFAWNNLSGVTTVD
jgi:hypothetical protein